MWRECEKLYMPWRDYGDLDFVGEGRRWQLQRHIYLMPFYYIDYTLAQTCAFQFWIKNEKDSSLAWKNYLNLCRAGGSLSFVKLVNLAKLTSPFEDGCLQAVVSKVEKWLKNFDLDSLL